MQQAKLWAIVLAVSLTLVFPWSGALGQEAPRLDKETLKGWLADPKVAIIDVRAPKDWDGSDKMIKGAVRQDPKDVKSWAAKLDKEKKIVLYCA